jgi:hypothetical protein
MENNIDDKAQAFIDEFNKAIFAISEDCYSKDIESLAIPLGHANFTLHSKNGLSDYARSILPTDSTFRQSCNISLKRRSDKKSDFEDLDKGVTFFILWLESLGIKTRYSCEGHLNGWYILFEASYKKAKYIFNIIDSVDSGRELSMCLVGRDKWRLSLTFDLANRPEDNVICLDKVADYILSTGFDYKKALTKN